MEDHPLKDSLNLKGQEQLVSTCVVVYSRKVWNLVSSVNHITVQATIVVHNER